MTYVTDPSFGVRVRAAMQWAQIESFAALAEAIDAPGYSERNLRNIAPPEDAGRDIQRLHIVAVAEATGLPTEFFTLAHDELVQRLTGGGGETGRRLDELADQVSGVRQAVAQLATRLGEVERDTSAARRRTGRHRGSAEGDDR